MADTPLCYFPDGSLATRDIPCKSPSLNGRASACCAFSDVCLDNHLCLGQDGPEVITRGSCTDQKWQSPECAQYCSDVNESNGAVIHPVFVQNEYMFCCEYGDRPGNGTCFVPTKGSIQPFSVEAGLVIYNRTSGSTTPINSTTTETVTNTFTVTATSTESASVSALRLASASSSSHTTPVRIISSSSSESRIGISAGISGLLGLAFLITLGLLWKQRRHKQVLRKEIQTWEDKYNELLRAKTVPVSEAEYRPSHQIDSWNPDDAGGRGHLPYQLQGWSPSEVSGAQISEMGDNLRRA